jgi:hypothetical protein
MIKRAAAAIPMLALIAGCVTNPIPDDYPGPTATIRDTAIQEGPSRAAFFYVAEVDGAQVRNALMASRSANYGQGNRMTAKDASRKVPARKLVLKLEARTAHGAPIAEIFNSANMYSASAVVTLDAKPDAVYVVKGMLTAGTRTVWLEDAASGQRVGQVAAGDPSK